MAKRQAKSAVKAKRDRVKQLDFKQVFIGMESISAYTAEADDRWFFDRGRQHAEECGPVTMKLPGGLDEIEITPNSIKGRIWVEGEDVWVTFIPLLGSWDEDDVAPDFEALREYVAAQRKLMEICMHRPRPSSDMFR